MGAATTETASTAISPSALQQNEGEALWFMGALATIKASSETTDGRVAVIELLAPIEAPAGSFVYGPRDVPHSFLVSSPEARYLLVAEPAGFENFMRAVGQPAPTLTIPPAGPPSDPAPLVAAAAECGIDILGQPGIPA
jgi:hypothetical protein